MHYLVCYLPAIFCMAIATAIATALPILDNGLGAQFKDSQNPSFISPIQPPRATNTASPQASADTRISQDNNGLDEPNVAALKAILGSAPNTTSTNITTADKPTGAATHNSSLEAEAINFVNSALSAENISVININPQPYNKSTAPAAESEHALQDIDNGLLAQGNGTSEMVYGPLPKLSSSPTPSPSKPATAASAPTLSSSSSSSVHSSPTSSTTSSTISSPLTIISAAAPAPAAPARTSKPISSAVVQDNGLQAQDSGSINIEIDPTNNLPTVNEPHERHHGDGTIVLVEVQDTGLQSQDVGGANVVWTAGEAYGGGTGGEVNVPVVVKGGFMEQDTPRR